MTDYIVTWRMDRVDGGCVYYAVMIYKGEDMVLGHYRDSMAEAFDDMEVFWNNIPGQ